MRPIRVLMLNYEFPPFGGGTGTACRSLLQEFARRDDVVADLVTSGRSAERQELGPRVTVQRLPTPKRDLHYWRPLELALWTARAAARAAALTRGRSYDLAHCWAGWPSGLVAYQLRRRLPYVVSLRGSDVPGYNPRLRVLDPLLMRHVVRRVWRRSARVVAVSRDLRALALRTDAGVSIDVIPNGVDLGRFLPATPGAGGLLFVGRLIPRKGAHLLVEAFGMLAQEHPDLTLTLVGEGPERARLEAMVRERGLDGRVRLRGHLQGRELVEAYRDAAVFVLPALSEAMPNVVLEAMAAGLAIVTTRTGAQELIAGNGLLVEQPDARSLAATLRQYLAAPDLMARHQRASRRLAESMSWSSVAEYFLEVYRDVVASPLGIVTAPAREFRAPAA